MEIGEVFEEEKFRRGRVLEWMGMQRGLENLKR